jgi:hypothetical protein
MTKWYWPTWSDWLSTYGQSITNWAFKGYCNNQMYWQLLDKAGQLQPNDHVIIMWPRNERIINWYDKEWVDKYQCEGFFPNTEGKLWFGLDNVPYMGMYRTHPDHQYSLTHSIISGFACILQTQQFLDSLGITYTMAFAQNPWVDGRPTYTPNFQTRWDHIMYLSKKELELSNNLLKIESLRTVLNSIDWTVFVDAPKDIDDPTTYNGIWEYYISKKEYMIYKHDVDNHPTVLAHHDWAVEKILKKLTKNAQYRKLAKELSIESMSMDIPKFTSTDYVAGVDAQLLDEKFRQQLNFK